ncbi:D-serine ammonia-lyase [Acidovorax sp. NCPPB 4044]|uniref:D-serine ammonia-lyase n=1 Tax=Acidovorax sp. NCPPB 4044 TaxID=2940490 RepID=UPI00230283B8|nr:D-serine ammonia-lyase [Acidovorax sp. NCPPB 4044]MDA8520844.1 D-serine ammonia-lyase [Acidovorax sp. NCPPB 4044]
MTETLSSPATRLLLDAAVDSALRRAEPCLWLNPRRRSETPDALEAEGWRISLHDTHAAAARFGRFAGLLAELFPELQASGGAIESPLLPVDALGAALGLGTQQGRLWIKADHGLPVAGSIKARGGIHEVLEFAEALALREGLVVPGADYRCLAHPEARAVFAKYQVAVGSTGNLGLSIGVAASALGLRAAVHMSADAKAWKKERLRRRGVEVVEHSGDYERAVAAGRSQAASDPYCHFVDDERSLSLLLGYSAAALTLRGQLAGQGIAVDAEHPLFVYLPCGVGGAPAGIAFGLRLLLGPHVHCFFAEPVQSPCFLVQMAAPEGSHPSVYDVGLNNRTEADGLAVPRASLLATQLMDPLLSGVFTVRDDTLFEHLVRVLDATGERIEPSAAAGFDGPGWLAGSEAGRRWLHAQGLAPHLPRATHVVWTTGGLFVPEAEHRRFEQRGRELLAGG